MAQGRLHPPRRSRVLYTVTEGDYPPLDISSKSRLWGKRHFWRFRRDRPLRSGDSKKAPVRGRSAKTLTYTLIVSAITSCVMQVGELHAVGIDGGVKRGWIASSEYLPAKSGYMTWSIGQNIRILCPAPQIKKLSARLNIHDVLRCQRRLIPVRSLTAIFNSLGGQYSSSGRSEWISSPEIKPRWHRRIAQEAISINLKLASWSIAAIFPSGGKSPVKMSSTWVWLVEWPDPNGGDKCTFIGNECVPGELGLLASGEPQRTSKGGYYECGESRDADAMALNKQARAGDIGNDDSAITGWIIFGGGVGFSILLVIYAALKERR